MIERLQWEHRVQALRANFFYVSLTSRENIPPYSDQSFLSRVRLNQRLLATKGVHDGMEESRVASDAL